MAASRTTTSWAGGSLLGASRVPLWLDTSQRPDPRPSLESDLLVDLLVVGGGFTGLWAAVIAAEQNPGRSIVLLEAGTLGWAASGRNGGFCSASLTHGLANGLSRWPDELALLQRLGRENLDAIEQTIRRYGIDCDWLRAGEMVTAVRPWQVDALAELASLSSQLGEPASLVDGAGARSVANSHTYQAGLVTPTPPPCSIRPAWSGDSPGWRSGSGCGSWRVPGWLR